MPSEDDLDCAYDSTWESLSEDEDDSSDRGDQCGATGRAQKYFWNYKCSSFGFQSTRNLRAAKDMQIYRHGYPNLRENEENTNKEMCNLLFYQNTFPSEPDGVTIEEFHSDWKTNYRKLERIHSYIQWLFPLREPGMNYRAYELTKKEIKAFQQCEEAKQRLVESYKLMLGFYGIELVDEGTGEVRRANNWEDRFSNLNRNTHNNLRISRILKCLGELGFEHYQAPLVKFFLTETLVNKELSSVKRSALDYFLFSIRDKKKRRELIEYAYHHYESKEPFVWCPRKIQKRFKRRNTPGENSKEKGGGGSLSTCKVSQCEAAQPVLEKGEEKQKDEEPEKERKGETTQDLAESVDAERKDKGSSLEEGSSVDNELDNPQRCQDNNVQTAEGTSDASLNGDDNTKESKDEGLEEDCRRNYLKPKEDLEMVLSEAGNNGETFTDDTGLKNSEPVDQADITDNQGTGTGSSEMLEMAAAKDNESGVQTDACVSEGTDEDPDCEQNSSETVESNPAVIHGGSCNNLYESTGSVSQAQLSEDQTARMSELPNQTANPGNKDTVEQEELAEDTNAEVQGSHTHTGQSIGCISQDVEMSDGDEGATNAKVESPSPVESETIKTNNEGAAQDSDMEYEIF
ncbi:opioid growth factor receptor-like protein 1 isoform X1 [Polyodon spathula]|uniref:opioid growth factor receptor-like protein 1 isoform X1 n=1 Tax=Polyodon spathula TaxID=7913 RepID=UPI001B7DC39C|nr:opioid growth factor receptor-like protein 1 isoform X1 [Polyodon spathula]